MLFRSMIPAVQLRHVCGTCRGFQWSNNEQPPAIIEEKMVEAAGVEPASEITQPQRLHVYPLVSTPAGPRGPSRGGAAATFWIIFRPLRRHYATLRTSLLLTRPSGVTDKHFPFGRLYGLCLSSESEVVVVVGNYANLMAMIYESAHPSRHAALAYRDPVETVSPP